MGQEWNEKQSLRGETSYSMSEKMEELHVKWDEDRTRNGHCVARRDSEFNVRAEIEELQSI